MTFVDLPLAMAHCRADDEDRNLVAFYLSAAQQSALAYLNRTVYASTEELEAAVTADEAGEFPMLVNPSVNAAILLTTGHLFAHREQVIVGSSVFELPMGARDFLRPYRIIPGV